LYSLLVPLSDLLVAGTWAVGLMRNEINWRGNRFAVREGTRLEPVGMRRYVGTAQIEPG
jgi:hypothetical protein